MDKILEFIEDINRNTYGSSLLVLMCPFLFIIAILGVIYG